MQFVIAVASLGGRPAPGVTIFGGTPFYDAFVMQTFSFNLSGLHHPHTQRKSTGFRRRPFFFWSSLTFGPKTN